MIGDIDNEGIAGIYCNILYFDNEYIYTTIISN